MTSAKLQIYFRQNTSSMMKWVSRLVGERPVKKISYNKNDRDKEHDSINYSESHERVIQPHEVGSLMDGEIVTIYSRAIPIGKAVPYYKDFRRFYDRSLAKS